MIPKSGSRFSEKIMLNQQPAMSVCAHPERPWGVDRERLMHRNKVVSREDWFQAHKVHLAREKELTRLRERIAAERRELPWLKIRKDYVFETEQGPKKLAELFAGR